MTSFPRAPPLPLPHVTLFPHAPPSSADPPPHPPNFPSDSAPSSCYSRPSPPCFCSRRPPSSVSRPRSFPFWYRSVPASCERLLPRNYFAYTAILFLPAHRSLPPGPCKRPCSCLCSSSFAPIPSGCRGAALAPSALRLRAALQSALCLCGGRWLRLLWITGCDAAPLWPAWLVGSRLLAYRCIRCVSVECDCVPVSAWVGSCVWLCLLVLLSSLATVCVALCCWSVLAGWCAAL